MKEEKSKFKNIGVCHNCGKEKLGGNVNYNTEEGIIVIFVCDYCYEEWYLK